MKKTISVLLILSLLLTLCPAFSAAAAETAVLWSQDFESGMLADLGTPLGSDEDGYYASGTVRLAMDGANGSDYCLHISGANSGNGQYIFGLEPDTSYTVSFKAKQANNAGAAYPNLGVKEYNAAGDYKAAASFTNAWTDYSLEFKTGAAQTSALVYTWIFGSGAVDFYVDDIKLFKTPEVVFDDPFAKWDFEDGDLAAIGTPLGSDADGYYASGTVALASGGAGGSDYCLKIAGANSGNGQYIFGLEPNTAYTITFDAKQKNNAGTAFPSIGVKEYNSDGDYITVDTIASDWTAYKLDFTTGADKTTALFYTWIFGEGAVDLLLDNVKLTKKAPDPQGGELLNWNFESGKTADVGTPDSSDADGYYASGKVAVIPGGDASDYCLQIKDANSGNGQWLNGLESDTEYVLTFRARYESCDDTAYPNVGVNGYDGDKYKTHASFNAEWGTYNIRFTTGKDSTKACVYTWVFGEGNVDFRIDNVSVVKASDYVENPDGLPELKILFVGNSYTDNTFDYIRQVGEASGYHLTAANLWIPGSTIARRWAAIQNNEAAFTYERTWDAPVEKTTYHAAMADQNWDYIILHQQANAAGFYEDWFPAIGEILDFFAERVPGAEVALFQAWSVDAGADYNGFERYDNDTEKMATAIIETGKKIAKRFNIDTIVPIGTAFRTLRAEGYTMTRADHIHANDLGSYVAAQTVFSMLTGILPSEDTFRLNRLTDEEAAQVRAAIIDAVEEYDDYRAADDPNVIVPDIDDPDEPDWSDIFAAWDFESGKTEEVGTPISADADGYYATGDVSVVPGGAGGSAYCLKIAGANSGNGQRIFGLEPNTTYTITFDAKQANNAGKAFPSIGIKEYDGTDAYQTAGTIGEDWAEYSLTFTTGTDNTTALFYTWVFGEGAVDLLLDNVRIESAAPSENKGLAAWNFEAGRLSALGTAENGDGDSYYGSGNLSIVSGGAEGTNYALKIANANSGNGVTIDGLSPETEYSVTFWAKELNNAGKAFPSIGIKNFDGTDAYLTLSHFTKDWNMYSLQFTTGKDCASALFYTWIFGEGATELYIDEVRIRAHSSDPFADWDFEENNIWLLGSPSNSDGDGYYASGSLAVVEDEDGHCLKISDANSGNGKTITGLKPATGYTIEFSAKLANASGSAFPAIGVKEYYNTAYTKAAKEFEPYQMVNTFTTQWQTYRLNFRTGDNTASALFYTWIFGSGTIDLLLDDVKIYENTDLQAEMLPAWDFEAGTAAAIGTPDGNDADGYYAEGNVSVVSGGADGSAYALKISGANSGNGQYFTGLDRDAEYVLTFSAKLENWNGSAFPSVGVNGYDGDAFVVCDQFTNDWAEYELRFRTTDDSNEACVYTWIFGSGEADLLLDNVSLQRATDWFTEKEPAEDYDYAFAVIGDPQIVNQYYPEKLPVMFDWLTDQVEARKISYVFGMGDSTHYDSDAEWTRIMSNYQRLDGLVPYTIVRGNHDSAAQYEKYFGIDSYLNQFEGCFEGKPENTWRLLETGAKTYLILSLDNGASDAVLAWAGEVITAHPDCSVIVATHSYLAPDGSLNCGVPPKSLGAENDPIDIWQKFISKYENIQLVLCGHESSERIVLSRQEGDAGNVVTQIMIDGQETDAAQNYGPYGGAGLIALLCFSENGSHVEVEYYSTLREQYFMECNQFSFELGHSHSFIPGEQIAPTCTEDGYTLYTCECGESCKADFVAALGHNYVDGICTRCGEKDPNYVPPTPADPCEGYTDINRNSWYHAAADYVIARGIMGSTQTGALTFEPNTKVSRAMVASILYRMEGSPAVTYKATFTDVKNGKWFTSAIEWCAQNGLASGKGDGKFDPNGDVTRQELAVFMMKMAEYLGRDTSGRADLTSFADGASVPAWAKTYVSWAVSSGLISGKAQNGKTMLAPKDNATRAEFASIIMRFAQKTDEG